MVYEFDWSIGRILAKLDEHGLAQNTLVIVTSDNGGVAMSDEGDNSGLFPRDRSIPKVENAPRFFLRDRLIVSKTGTGQLYLRLG